MYTGNAAVKVQCRNTCIPKCSGIVLEPFTLEVGTDRSSRDVCIKLPTYTA